MYNVAPFSTIVPLSNIVSDAFNITPLPLMITFPSSFEFIIACPNFIKFDVNVQESDNTLFCIRDYVKKNGLYPNSVIHTVPSSG